MNEGVAAEAEIKKAPGAVWPVFVYFGMMVPYWIIGHDKELSPRMYIPTLVLGAVWFVVSVSIKSIDLWRRRRGKPPELPFLWLPWFPVAAAALKIAAIRMPDGSRPEFLLYRVTTSVLLGITSCFFIYWAFRFWRVAKGKQDSPEANRMADAFAGGFFLLMIMDP